MIKNIYIIHQDITHWMFSLTYHPHPHDARKRRVSVLSSRGTKLERGVESPERLGRRRLEVRQGSSESSERVEREGLEGGLERWKRFLLRLATVLTWDIPLKGSFKRKMMMLDQILGYSTLFSDKLTCVCSGSGSLQMKMQYGCLRFTVYPNNGDQLHIEIYESVCCEAYLGWWSRLYFWDGWKGCSASILICWESKCEVIWLVVSKIFYFPFHIWDVILPIDELHHFSEG